MKYIISEFDLSVFYIFFQVLSVPFKSSCKIPSENSDSDPSFFCFGGEEGKGGCRGDSGGPVMVKDKLTDRYYHIYGSIQ